MIMSCIQSVKDTKFKAIHNNRIYHNSTLLVVFNLSKIQNLKRFTTKTWRVKKAYKLYSICQRYKI